jgi:hypothetical protein
MVREAAVVSVLVTRTANVAMRLTARPWSRWRDCANSGHYPGCGEQVKSHSFVKLERTANAPGNETQAVITGRHRPRFDFRCRHADAASECGPTEAGARERSSG